MTIEILTPGKKLFSGEATSVNAPGKAGRLGILNNHASLITTLKEGKIEVATADGIQTFDVNGGVLEVLNNHVIILAE
ncbi:MAG: ATP synthase F1 subunit epsilon [Flavobacteriales bacterium]|nr:ATP synthase F1 subunit epsilon [Flavobacteriales bacterium]